MSQDKIDEGRTRGFLEEIGFEVKEFSKEERKKASTPDFRILKNKGLIFFCEVKTIAEDNWLYKIVSAAPEETIVGGSRNDPRFNRISAKIHDAVSQFRSVNPDHKYPNVLVFMSHDKYCRYGSLLQTIRGDFFAQSGEHHPIFLKYSEGRIKEEKFEIDLFIWFDNLQEEPYWLFGKNEEHFLNLCKYFDKNPWAIKSA